MVTIAGRVRIRNRGRITNGTPTFVEPTLVGSSFEQETYAVASFGNPDLLGSALDSSLDQSIYVGASISTLLFQTEFVDSSIESLLPQGGLVSDYALDPVQDEFEIESSVYVGMFVDQPDVQTVYVDAVIDMESYSEIDLTDFEKDPDKFNS
jgi:hypothetical protein